MIFYVIRHKASGELMPQCIRGRGYSHWNPNRPLNEINKLVFADIPRLFSRLRTANKSRILWASQPNLHRKVSYSYNESEDDNLQTTNDGRKLEDIEVIEARLETFPLS